jgi:hypothetical protein
MKIKITQKKHSKKTLKKGKLKSSQFDLAQNQFCPT